MAKKRSKSPEDLVFKTAQTVTGVVISTSLAKAAIKAIKR